MEPTKERIEKEAISYVIQETGYQVLPEHDHWKESYIAGATAEHERAQQELQAYRDMIKELLPLAEKYLDYIGDMTQSYEGYESTIQEARKLINTVTPT